MIKPTVGRVVLFRRCAQWHQPGFIVEDPTVEMAATVAYVWSDRLVNLSVVDHGGATHRVTSVRLLQDDDTPGGDSHWCEWMPYQKGQAAKTEAAEKTALELGAAARATGASSY